MPRDVDFALDVSDNDGQADDESSAYPWECIRGATLKYDPDKNLLVPEFYINWLGWPQEDVREPLENIDHSEKIFATFCKNIDPRCIRDSGLYPEGQVIFPTQEYKSFCILRAVEGHIDLVGYQHKLAVREPSEEDTRAEMWAEEDREMTRQLEHFRQRLEARRDFHLLGEWSPITDAEIHAPAHDYRPTHEYRRWGPLQLATTPDQAAFYTRRLFDEIFGQRTVNLLRSNYIRRREQYQSLVSGIRGEESIARLSDENAPVVIANIDHDVDVELDLDLELGPHLDLFYDEPSAPTLDFNTDDGYPGSLKRLPGSELWTGRKTFSPGDRIRIMTHVMAYFGKDAVRQASKRFRQKAEENRACNIWRLDEIAADVCTECWHWFEKSALIRHFKEQNAATCPICRHVLTVAPFPVDSIIPAARRRAKG